MHPSEVITPRRVARLGDWFTSLERSVLLGEWMFEDALPPITLHPLVLEAIAADRAVLPPR